MTSTKLQHRHDPYLWDVDDETLKSQQEYYRNIVSARKAAIEQPLAPGVVFHSSLHLLDSVVHPVSDLYPRRPLPLFAIKEQSSILTCQLVRPLRTGIDIHAQVWVAEVLDGSGTHVVFKFLQPSLMRLPCPDYTRIYIQGTWEYVNPLVVAQKENDAYVHLSDLQGSYLPYFYGIHSVRMSLLVQVML